MKERPAEIGSNRSKVSDISFEAVRKFAERRGGIQEEMIFNLHVEPYEITDLREYKIDFPNKGEFPILLIDKGSYIAGANVETSLNFHVEHGCYNLQIGKYCALAEDILFMLDLMHDYQYVSMGAIAEFKDIMPKEDPVQRSRVRRKGQVLIENDVWIGHGATIMGGVTIHSGAVIGAEAVVTKDVPPYAIVAGNPARIVKYRFERDEILRMLDIAWWHWDSDVLKSRYQEMRMPVTEFIRCFEKEAARKKEEMQARPNPINKNVSGLVYACIADMEKNFPVCPKIIDEFCRKFQSMDGQLVIYIMGTRERNLAGILETLAPYEETDCSIQIIDEEGVNLSDVIRFADCYITNRDSKDLIAVELGYLFQKKVLSGVDIPIW